MNERLNRITQAARAALQAAGRGVAGGGARMLTSFTGARRMLITLAVAGAGAWVLVQHPPLHAVGAGEAVVRTNALTGDSTEFRDGVLLALPGLHALKTLPLRDRLYRALAGRKAQGEAPFQSNEGLSLGLDLAIRYALDATRLTHAARALPEDIDGEVVEPAVQGVIYRVLARYTVREILATRRAEIQQVIESELRPRLAADGIVLKSVQIGQVDLPPEYRSRLDTLLAEELGAQKMRYTLEVEEKRVKETELKAQADKVRRETAAAAAAQEQVIAARAQEEAMRHVLPFKQKQIEQRQLEAEAEKLARIKAAEGSAQARRIEAAGEADSRRKLAEAEADRLERIGKVASEQMARDGELVTRHPLLIQKTVADKLSDKIQVIIAPPGGDGRFVAAGLIGAGAEGAK